MRRQEGTRHYVHKKHKYDLQLLQKGITCVDRCGVFTVLCFP